MWMAASVWRLVVTGRKGEVRSSGTKDTRACGRRALRARTSPRPVAGCPSPTRDHPHRQRSPVSSLGVAITSTIAPLRTTVTGSGRPIGAYAPAKASPSRTSNAAARCSP